MCQKIAIADILSNKEPIKFSENSEIQNEVVERDEELSLTFKNTNEVILNFGKFLKNAEKCDYSGELISYKFSLTSYLMQ